MTKSTKRLDSVDALRGIAVCGILIVNIAIMRNLSIDISRADFPLDWWVMRISSIYFIDTMRGIFSFLFGVSICLMVHRGIKLSTLKKRSFVLICIGLIHATILLWYLDILFLYGIASLFVIPRSQYRASSIIRVLKVFVIIIFSYLLIHGAVSSNHYTSGKEALLLQKSGVVLNDAQNNSLKIYEEYLADLNRSKNEFPENKALRLNGYLPNLALSVKLFYEYAIAGILVHFFEITLTMLLGVLFYKLGLLRKSERVGHILKRMLVLGYGIAVPIRIFLESTYINNEYYWFSDVFNEISRLAMIAGHIGAFLLFFNVQKFKLFTSTFASVGKIALTNYIAQSVILAVIFYGFGYFGSYNYSTLIIIGIGIICFQIIFSLAWLKKYSQGPLEMAWRRIVNKI